ncbi:hypothetical protein GCM10010294_45970 [Streptomyces griseoloalbus]|nr:hypothetical protein GCM10010294_45970 [Streptomyces griseoloalbus]
MGGISFRNCGTEPALVCCTTKLQQPQRTLNGMGGALLADATRWENQADELERQAKEKDKARAGTGGN